MQSTTILQDLFDHNDWSNKRIHDLCLGLTDEQLDAPRHMGFGSLRNTLFHLLEAEILWLERWQNKPWRPLQADAQGMPVAAIAATSQRIAEERNLLLAEDALDGYQRIVQFKDSQESEYRFAIGDLAHHVANHGIHHRAQALSYMKSFDLKIVGGLDYLFFKLARPSCPQPDASIEPIRAFGLEVATGTGFAPQFEQQRLERYFAYNDWATHRILEESKQLSESQLDQDLGIGMGTMRKNIQHMIDAERWWLRNWTEENAQFPSGEDSRTLAELLELNQDVCQQRNQYLATLDQEGGNRIVEVSAGGPISRYRVTESLVQLCAHGTHHRAQCVNMLRQLGITFGWIDLIVWIRENIVVE